MFNWFATTYRQYPQIAIFMVLALGYYFGKFNYKGVGLGSVTATLLAVSDWAVGVQISQPLRAFAFLPLRIRR